MSSELSMSSFSSGSYGESKASSALFSGDS